MTHNKTSWRQTSELTYILIPRSKAGPSQCQWAWESALTLNDRELRRPIGGSHVITFISSLAAGQIVAVPRVGPMSSHVLNSRPLVSIHDLSHFSTKTTHIVVLSAACVRTPINQRAHKIQPIRFEHHARLAKHSLGCN